MNRNPRINFTPPKKVYHLITRLSELTGKPKSLIVSQFLIGAAPTIENLIELLEKADAQPKEFVDKYNKVVIETINGLTQSQMDLSEEFNHRTIDARIKRDLNPDD